MNAVPTIWNLISCVPVAASRTKQTIGATVFLAKATESVTVCAGPVTTLVDCEKETNGFSKNKRLAEQYRVILRGMAVLSATLETGVNLSANDDTYIT